MPACFGFTIEEDADLATTYIVASCRQTLVLVRMVRTWENYFAGVYNKLKRLFILVRDFFPKIRIFNILKQVIENANFPLLIIFKSSKILKYKGVKFLSYVLNT